MVGDGRELVMTDTSKAPSIIVGWHSDGSGSPEVLGIFDSRQEAMALHDTLISVGPYLSLRVFDATHFKKGLGGWVRNES